MSRGVNTADGPYAVAVAELPLSAHRSADRAGAVVVVPGDAGWRDAARRAEADGAAAIIVRDPGVIDAVRPPASAGTAPIVIERVLLRSDVAFDAGQAPVPELALIQVECSGSSAEFDTVLRDAIGWARVLGGGALTLLTVTATSRGLCVLLERPAVDAGDRPVAVTVLASRRAASAWIRAVAIGADRVEVTIDNARGIAAVERSTAAGRLTVPPRWESPERVVLRRALDAARDTDECAEWEQDATLVALIHEQESRIRESNTADRQPRVP